MTGVLKFVDVGPNFGTPGFIVDRHFAAGSTAGVESPALAYAFDMVPQFDKDAAHVFDIIVGINDVLVTQKVTEAEFLGFSLGFLTGVEGAILGPKLLGRITSHPEDLFMCHGSSTAVKRPERCPEV